MQQLKHVASAIGAQALLLTLCLSMAGGRCAAQPPAALSPFVVANNDVAQFDGTVGAVDAAVFFNIGEDGSLGPEARVRTLGHGMGGGDFAANRVVVAATAQGNCVFATNGSTQNIVAIDAAGRTISGSFTGPASDIGSGNGTGLAASSAYLYASYSQSGTIGTFAILPGCALRQIGDVTATGLANGWVTGMAIHGPTMVVAYGDGSIESFNISGGVPVSRGDRQNSTGFKEDHLPNGVDITSDGRYAIFGDASTVTTVEVSDMSSGKLTRTVAYNLGTGWNSCTIRLSPDESTLFIVNNSSGQVTAAFFDKVAGRLRRGCTSPTLRGFYSQWGLAGNVRLQLPTGTGGSVYVPELGAQSGIAVLRFVRSAKGCVLSETGSSPVVFNALDAAQPLSLDVFPPRPF